jgi:ribulose 1,5-bisphosphate synthetase/thiazole synthase
LQKWRLITVFSSPMMGAIFGGMLLSEKKAADIIFEEVLRGE